MSGAFRLFGLCGAIEIMTFELTVMLLQENITRSYTFSSVLWHICNGGDLITTGETI